MKNILLLLSGALLITSCTIGNGEEKVVVINKGIAPETILYSGNYKIVNDTIATIVSNHQIIIYKKSASGRYFVIK